MKKSFGKVVNARLLTLAALAMLTAFLAALGLFAARFATNSLLQMEAASDARDWTNHLSIGSAGLTGLAQGTAPTAESRRHLDDALGIAGVYAFRIYDIKGVMKCARMAASSLPAFLRLWQQPIPNMRRYCAAANRKPSFIAAMPLANRRILRLRSCRFSAMANRSVGLLLTSTRQNGRPPSSAQAATVALLICAVLMRDRCRWLVVSRPPAARRRKTPQ